MAAPTREGFAGFTTGNSNVDTLSCSMTTLAASALAGDKVALFCASDGIQTQSISSGTGWTYVTQATHATDVCLGFFEFTVTVNGTIANLVIDMGATTERARAHAVLVRPPSGTTLTRIGPATDSGISQDPDPGALSNSSGITVDPYFIAAVCGDCSSIQVGFSAAPTGYGNLQSNNIPNGEGIVIGTADKSSTGWTNGASEDPDNFERSNVATEEWATLTVAYYGASGGGSITASAAPELSTFTTSAAVKVDVKASGSLTPASFTSSAATTVRVQATASPTPSTFSTISLACVRINATAAPVLDTFTTSEEAAVRIHISGSPTLSDFSISAVASASQSRTLTGSPSLSTLTTSAATAVRVKATATLTLDAFSAASSSVLPIENIGSPTLGSFTTASAVTVRVKLDGSPTLDPFTIEGVIRVTTIIPSPVPDRRTTYASPLSETAANDIVTTYASPLTGTGE